MLVVRFFWADDDFGVVLLLAVVSFCGVLVTMFSHCKAMISVVLGCSCLLCLV